MFFNSIKYLIVILLVLLSLVVNAQNAVVVKDFKPEKYPETEWGPDNKHFAHYYIRYSGNIPIYGEKHSEKLLLSGNFATAYIYRYKIFDKWDIGTEIFYENSTSVIKKQNFNLFSANDEFKRMRLYENGFGLTIFSRWIISGNTIRNIGIHFDIGAFVKYSAWPGLFKYSKDADEKIRIRQKSPDYLQDLDYGLIFRAGKDNFAFFARYSLIDKSISLNNINYYRSPFSAGLQFNLYVK